MPQKISAVLLCLHAVSYGQSLFPSGLTRFAGADVSSLIGDGGTAYNAVFGRAAGLARDGAGNFYIAEPTRIRKADTRGTVTTLVSANNPASLSLDGKGNLYFIENHALIRRVAPDGT